MVFQAQRVTELMMWFYIPYFCKMLIVKQLHLEWLLEQVMYFVALN